ncbi:MAG: thiolase family protein [Chloroflexi bacterium]|nr:thiolase family protein [Chloroflexota bacterium]
MNDVVIVDAIRTPLGKRNGWLREQHPVKLGARVVAALLERNELDKSAIDHVIFGCVSQVAEQTMNIARNIVLDAELPIELPATTIDFQCGSSQQAIHLAAAMVASAQADLVIAGGVESMTRVPMGSSLGAGGASPFTDNIMEAYNMIPQGIASDEIAAKWGITRAAMDELGLLSHQRAWAATENGALKREIVPIQGVDDAGALRMFDRDQGIRPTTTREKMASLEPVFNSDGVTTAGNSSQISDGAAALLVTSARRARQWGLKPRARLIAPVTIGSDPHLMLTGPIAATFKALERAALGLDDIDVFEVNEAFASVPRIWEKETGVDLEKVNIHGGAIALGHPLGGSGARLMTALINALEMTDTRYGLQTMCCGGGMATATIIERWSTPSPAFSPSLWRASQSVREG